MELNTNNSSKYTTNRSDNETLNDKVSEKEVQSTQIQVDKSKKSYQSDYIRVGTQYYRIVAKPTATVNPTTQQYVVEDVLLRWDKETIKDDHSKEFLHKIPKYYGFINLPSHVDYQQAINGFYNQYHKLKYQPKEGACTITLDFIQHIFGEQYELGLDYLAILYLRPTEILPILCLVSDERKTGKSTFIFWLNELFGSNCTINDNNDFEGRFNSDWTAKLLIAVEETLIEKRTIYERIKSLSTAKSHKTEAKGKDKTEGSFYGKFILCSNFEDSFIPIDSKEIRFWVRKIHTFESKGVAEDVNMLKNLVAELPAFLHLLQKRGIQTPKRTRMWFTETQIQTEALERLKKNNMPRVHKALKDYLTEILQLHQLDYVCYTPKDLMDILKDEGLRTVEKSYLIKVLQKDLELSVEGNSWYDYYNEKTEGEPLKLRGRYYKFTRELLGLPPTQNLTNSVIVNQPSSNDDPFEDYVSQNTKNFTKDLF